jgi:hypothetical protein
LRIALVYPGDPDVRCLATPENNRFSAVFAAFAARGVDAQPPSTTSDKQTSFATSC